jgi:hypothetical protein
MTFQAFRPFQPFRPFRNLPLGGAVTGPTGPTDPLASLIQQLYGQGEQGAYYIAQPVVRNDQSLWQNDNGTVAVETSGDPTGRADDLSPNNLPWTQSTSARRPAYIYTAETDRHAIVWMTSCRSNSLNH